MIRDAREGLSVVRDVIVACDGEIDTDFAWRIVRAEIDSRHGDDDAVKQSVYFEAAMYHVIYADIPAGRERDQITVADIDATVEWLLDTVEMAGLRGSR